MRNCFLKTIAALIFGLLIAYAPAPASAASYGPYPEETYQLCGTGTAATAVVVMHGGWDMTGDSTASQVQTLCNYLGARAMDVFNINYRLTTTKGQGWPAQWQDLQLAVRFLRNSGYNRVGIVGTSAGAYNALGVTFRCETITAKPTDPMAEAALYDGISSCPDFTVALSPFSDLSDPALNQSALDLLTTGIGAQTAYLPKATIRAIASPITMARAGAGPILLIHGLHDQTVPVLESQKLSRQMTYIGGNMKFMLTNGRHVLQGYTPAQLNTVLAAIAACAKGAVNSGCAE
jgi:acetyl esterase/lipase